VHGPSQIINQKGILNTILLSAITGIPEFLFPALVRAVVLSRVWFPHIDREKLEAPVSELCIELIEGRDLAREGRSSNASKLQEHMFVGTKLRKANALSLERL
jgi:hypothetical protein